MVRIHPSFVVGSKSIAKGFSCENRSVGKSKPGVKVRCLFRFYRATARLGSGSPPARRGTIKRSA